MANYSRCNKAFEGILINWATLKLSLSHPNKTQIKCVLQMTQPSFLLRIDLSKISPGTHKPCRSSQFLCVFWWAPCSRIQVRSRKVRTVWGQGQYFWGATTQPWRTLSCHSCTNWNNRAHLICRISTGLERKHFCTSRLIWCKIYNGFWFQMLFQ